MRSAGYHDFLFRAFDFGVDIVGEILGMCLIPGNQHNRRIAQFLNIAHQLKIKETIRCCRIPSRLVGINGSGMECPANIIAKEILDNRTGISRQIIGEHGIEGFHISLGIYAQFMRPPDRLAGLGFFITLLSNMFLDKFPLFRRIVSTIIVVTDALTHIVHSRSCYSLNPAVTASRCDCHAGQTTNPHSTYLIGIDKFQVGYKVNRCMIIFREDFRRTHIAAAATALTGHGRVKGHRHKTILSQFLCVKTRGLLFYCTKRSGYHHGFILLAGIKIFRQVQMPGHFKTKTVGKSHILGFD